MLDQPLRRPNHQDSQFCFYRVLLAERAQLEPLPRQSNFPAKNA